MSWGYNQTNSGSNIYAPGGDVLCSTGTACTRPQRVRVGLSVGGEYLNNILSISASRYNNVAVRNDGTVFNWGENTHGELGRGNTVGSRYPTQVFTALTGVTERADTYTNRGNAETGDKYNYLNDAPRVLRNITAVDAGNNYVLAISHTQPDTASVYSWGLNANGQLGIGNTDNQPLPAVVNLSNVDTTVQVKGEVSNSGMVVQISAGGYFSLLMTQGGAVYSWGANNLGQLGIEASTGAAANRGNVLMPTPVLDGANQNGHTKDGVDYIYVVQSISAGYTHGAVVNYEGYALGWGDNGRAQLGDFTTVQKNSPIKIGTEEYYALEPSYTEMLRKGETAPTVYSSTSANKPPLAIEISYGDKYTLFNVFGKIMEAVHYKGFNLYSDTERSRSPINITFRSSDESIVVVNRDATSTDTDASWTVQAASPENYGRAVVYFYVDIEVIDEASGQSTINRYSGALLVTVVPSDVLVAPMVAAGDGFTLALQSDGTVWAWGNNTYGQLGDARAYNYVSGNNRENNGDARNRNNVIQVQIPDGEVIKYIAAGRYHSLAVTTEGKVYAWGLNNYGQLGINSQINTSTPTLVRALNNAGAQLTDIIMVAAGETWSMALTNTGSVYTWGRNDLGQVGDNTGNAMQIFPVRLRGARGGGYMGNVIDIAAGDHHGLVVRSDGSVYSWGVSSDGRLGLGSGNVGDNNRKLAPEKVMKDAQTGLSGIIAVAAGAAHSMALTRGDAADEAADGNRVYAWGLNSDGQLGNGSTGGLSWYPVAVNGIRNITSISAGGNFSLAQVREDMTSIKQAYKTYAWGLNSSGQLGLGDTAIRNTATLTLFSDKTSATNPYPQYDNYIQSAFMSAAGYSHTVIIGIDGYVYTSGYNYYGGLGNGTNTNSAYPMRAGVREEDILIYDAAWDGNDIDDVTAETTALTDATISGSETVTVDVNKLFRKEYVGFNLRTTKDTNSKMADTLHTGGTWEVEILDESLLTVKNTGNAYTFSAKQDDRFGTTTVRFNYTYTDHRDSSDTVGRRVTDTYLLVIHVKDENATAISVPKVEAGYTHSVLLRPDGTVWTWGQNNNNQLGNGSDADSAYLQQVLVSRRSMTLSALFAARRLMVYLPGIVAL